MIHFGAVLIHGGQANEDKLNELREKYREGEFQDYTTPNLKVALQIELEDPTIETLPAYSYSGIPEDTLQIITSTNLDDDTISQRLNDLEIENSTTPDQEPNFYPNG